MIAPLLAVAFLLAQGDRPPGFQTVDGVAATVDDRLVTFANIDELLLAQADQLDRSDRAAITRAYQQVIEEFIRRRVREQGGAELGLAPEDVRRVARNIVMEQRRGSNPVEYGAQMRERGTDPLEEERRTLGQLYEDVWRASVTGRAVGGGRPRVDRYLRPSQLRAAYVQNKDVLGEPPTVELQVLDLLGSAAGGLDAAREQIEEWRAEIEAGADLGALARAYSWTARENAGRIDPVRADRISDPALRDFATRGRVGSLSPVLPLGNERGALIGFRLVRLLERVAGAPPDPFTDRNLQRELRGLLLDRADAIAIESAGGALLEQSELWVHPIWRPAVLRPPAPRR